VLYTENPCQQPGKAENGMDEASPSVGVEAKVSLREVTAQTVRDICDLSVAPGQERFVAPNSVSIAEAYFCEKAWFRAIYADETPVGFLMLYDDPQKPEYYLWRFMIADNHQGKGYARRAMELLIEHVRRRPMAEEMVLSYVPAEGSPEGFYRRLGFEPTGELLEGEVVMRLRLSDHPGRTAE
jgi:diamine N-acetyltransferase